MSKHHHDSNSEHTSMSAHPPEGSSKAESSAKEESAAKAEPAAGDAGSQIIPVDTTEVPRAGEGQAVDSRGAEGDTATSDAAKLDAAKDEIAALRAEVADLNEKYLRKLADEVNFRKRMVREKEDAQKFAVAGLLGDIIPILDDFDRGLASSENAKNYEQLHEGVALIRKQLSQMLENKYSLQRF